MTAALPFTQLGLTRVYIAGIGKFVKIGFSTNVEERLKTFRTSAVDVELLLTVPGGRELERKLHDLLSEARVTREMFRCDWRVISFIEHVNYGGLERGIEWLETTTPQRRSERKKEDRTTRDRVRALNRSQKDAYFASLVAERRRSLGW